MNEQIVELIKEVARLGAEVGNLKGTVNLMLKVVIGLALTIAGYLFKEIIFYVKIRNGKK